MGIVSNPPKLPFALKVNVDKSFECTFLALISSTLVKCYAILYKYSTSHLVSLHFRLA
jgi:hypothetical protein